jgi:transcriptional regulator with XRE-family HTH domain
VPIVKPIDPDRLLRDAGRRLAEFREARGLTQQELAEELGVSMRYVQRVEGGGENLTLRSLAGYASVLGATIAEIFQPPTTRKRRVGRPKNSK